MIFSWGSDCPRRGEGVQNESDCPGRGVQNKSNPFPKINQIELGEGYKMWQLSYTGGKHITVVALVGYHTHLIQWVRESLEQAIGPLEGLPAIGRAKLNATATTLWKGGREGGRKRGREGRREGREEGREGGRKGGKERGREGGGGRD